MNSDLKRRMLRDSLHVRQIAGVERDLRRLVWTHRAKNARNCVFVLAMLAIVVLTAIIAMKTK